ncbi:MAG: DEAD/DEAH box helicase [Candidatus Limnocylindria bacterium]
MTLARELRDPVEAILNDPELAALVTAHRTLEPRPPQYAPFPDGIDLRLIEALRSRSIDGLYTHQAAAVRSAAAGRNVCVVTPPASGKTLCYNLPVLVAIADDPAARALYLFPTKALAQDQLAELHALGEVADLELRTHTYDGDTPASVRSAIRTAGQVVLTNPDMLHAAILPHHTKWFRLFENLRFVVIDELHTYRGLFGSHVANVIRRLRRICRHYGSEPVFICASATIANPRALAERLIEDDVELIDHNGAPRGRKDLILVNPPVVNPQLGVRASLLLTARRVAETLLRDDVQTIVFGRSRTAVEVLTTYLRESFPRRPWDEHVIRGYRSGYLPRERRAIEAGLRSGAVRGVVATNALELGIDIGGMGAAVSVGYPGTIASLLQQFGRAGRRASSSVAVMVASSAPIDQFLVTHPDYLFGRSPEHALVNPDNLHLLLAHLKATAFELPVPDRERFGIDETATLLDVLTEDDFVRHADDGRFYWSHENFPASEVSLRSAAQENVVIVDTSEPAHRVIGEVDIFAAPMLVHEQAIYLHQGEQFHVDRLDWDERKAYVRRVDVDYYTDADLGVTLKVLDVFASRAEEAPVPAARGEVMVAWKASLFKKIKFHTHENVGWGPIRLPEQQMHTTATWLVIPDAVAARFERDALDGAVIGLARLSRNVAPLLLMCDPRDVGVLGQVQAPFTGRPTLYLYDGVPGGVGLAERLFELLDELLAACRQMAADCECESGCPSCVGPMAEVGVGGKSATVDLLGALTAAHAR